MRPEKKPRSSDPRLPDLDAEDEVDFGKHGRALAARWWLPLLGLLGGIVVGYLLSLGGKDVWQAKSTIYLGQPLSLSSTQVQSLSTNPSAVRQVVFAPSVQHQVEGDVGLRSGSLAGHVSTQAIAGAATALGRVGQNPLVEIVVTGSQPRRIADAANDLAKIATQRISGRYVTAKIANLKNLLASQTAAIKRNDQSVKRLGAAVNSPGLSTVERLIIASQLNAQTTQRAQLVDQQTNTQQLLALAQNVEQSTVLTQARAVKTTARSRRNSVVVAAFIGLILGLLAALLWEPIARLSARA